MSDFRALSDRVLASQQLTLADIDAAASAGVKLIVNNRPEGESEDQTPGAAIEAAARSAGMAYLAIPVSPGAFSHEQVQTMIEALGRPGGKVLAYCRTGTRSTLLWALAEAATGEPIEVIVEAAAAAGYDVAPVLPAMIELAQRG